MKFFLMFIILFNFTFCFSHPYILNKSESTKEDFYFKPQFVFGLVPTLEVNQDEVCPGKKIRLINMHDSFFNGLVCGGTLFIFCPHTIGIQCTK